MTDEELKKRWEQIQAKKAAGPEANLFGFDPTLRTGAAQLAPTASSSAAMTEQMAASASTPGGKPSGGGAAGKPSGGGAAGAMGAGGNVLNTALQAGMMVWQQKQAQKEAKKQREHEVAQKSGIDKQRAWGEGAQGEVGWWNNLGALMNRTLL